MSCALVASLATILRGDSIAIRGVRSQLARLLDDTFRSLLIVGETGVGKDLVPRALLACSPERWRHLEVFNCPAIPSDHLESELFGTMRGAFPGSETRPGALERAGGGILFLDEVAALAPHHQPKVLRMFDSGEGRRLGSTCAYHVETTLISATREDLPASVEAGAFREDLYYRLVQDGVLSIPPLRERAEDIPELVRLFQSECPRSHHFEPDALALLQAQPWPGNVRQLRAVVRSASRLAEGDRVDHGAVEEALSRICLTRARSEARRPEQDEEVFRLLSPQEQCARLQEALARAGGNQTQAGILLGFHRSRRGARGSDTLAARKLAHRKFGYWWRRLGLEHAPPRGARVHRIH